MPRPSFRLTYAFLLAALLFLLSLAAQPIALADPDFGSVSDILGGRRTLFRNDDLIQTEYSGNLGLDTRVLQTQDDAIADQILFGVTSTPNVVTRAPRMFDTPNDVIVTAFAGGIFVNDMVGGSTETFQNNLGTVSPDIGVVGDFTGDGFQDLAFIAGDNIYVATANNVTNIADGLFISTPLPLPGGITNYDLAAADFDADGITELALGYAYDAGNPNLDIFKPTVTNDANGQITSLSFNNVGTVQIPFTGSEVTGLKLTTGAYTGSASPTNSMPYRQIVMLYSGIQQDLLEFTYLAAITIVPSANPPQDTLTVENIFPWQADQVSVAGFDSAYLDFFSNTEQLVILYRDGIDSVLTIFTLDQDYNFAQASFEPVPGLIATGLGVGNFDQQSAESSPLVLELAVGGITLVDPACLALFQVTPVIFTYHLDPTNNYAISFNNQTRVGDQCYDDNDPNLPSYTLTTGDTQGRSLFVGTPSVMTNSHTQAHLVLGAPPMHVDYVTPDDTNPAEVVNVSAVPDTFYSQYSTVSTNTKQSSRTGINSMTNAASVSVSGGYRWGGAISGSVTVQAGASAGYMNEKYVSKQYSQYESSSFDASTITGFDDQVWMTIQTHYVYVFPVIGQTVCPDTIPNCQPDQRVPLLVMMSGPTISEAESVTASSVEWYQPVHQQGNIFTYPWNLTQLKLADGDIDLLTPEDPTGFSTDDSSTTEGVNWSGGSASGETSGTTNNINWSSYLSISSKPGIEGGAFGSAKVSYNGSKSLETLNTLTTSVGQSTGIGIVKPDDLSSNYAYTIFPYIYGENPPAGTVQTGTLTTTVQTAGLLRAGFVANPTDVTASPWWGETYTLPDLALAHPTRWSFSKVPYTTLPNNCLSIGDGIAQCANLSPITNDFANNDFLAIKGLTITPADSNGEGPMLTNASADESLMLQARIYNNSLTDIPPGSQVVVQFYGQPYDETSRTPNGSAFLIGNDTLTQGIPGFNSPNGGGVNPNWTLASTTFTPSNYADQYLVFWVLVVLKDAQGNPLPEMPGHGLTGIPPTLDSIAQATQWIEPYSNNLGLYQYLFYIAPSSSDTGVGAEASGRLEVDPLELSSSEIMLGEQVTISARVSANRDRDALAALFYLGNPATRGRAFDFEGISHVRGGSSYLVKTDLRPTRCGNHNLFFKLIPSGRTTKAKLNVTINPRKTLREMLNTVKTVFPTQEMLEQEKRGDGIIGRIKAARRAFKNNNPDAAFAALDTLQGRIEGQRGKSLPDNIAAYLLAQTNQIRSCVKR